MGAKWGLQPRGISLLKPCSPHPPRPGGDWVQAEHPGAISSCLQLGLSSLSLFFSSGHGLRRNSNGGAGVGRVLTLCQALYTFFIE